MMSHNIIKMIKTDTENTARSHNTKQNLVERLSKMDPEKRERFDQDSQAIREGREWMVDQACTRIREIALKNMNRVRNENGSLPNEMSFSWNNVKTDLMQHVGVLDRSGKNYNRDAIPFPFSFDTYFNGGFGSKTGRIDRRRFRDAGVKNPFVLDVKRAMSQECIKVWDISDTSKSKKVVWEITIFIQEIQKKLDEVEEEVVQEEVVEEVVQEEVVEEVVQEEVVEEKVEVQLSPSPSELDLLDDEAQDIEDDDGWTDATQMNSRTRRTWRKKEIPKEG